MSTKTTFVKDCVHNRRQKIPTPGITQVKEYNLWNRQSIPKRRHNSDAGITQEKEYNRWNRQSVPKRRHKIQTPGITQEKEYNR
jgi:hypothetical protein